MQLSAEKFADLKSAIESQFVQPQRIVGPKARATASRIRIAPVLAGRSSKSIEVVIRDFTPHGMNMLLSQTLKAGEKFVAEFPSQAERVVNLLCTVCRSDQTSDGLWLHACEYICAITASHASDAAEIHRISASMFDW